MNDTPRHYEGVHAGDTIARVTSQIIITATGLTTFGIVPGRHTPVGLEKGASPGLAKVQPVCVSDESSGLVFCQVGCVTDSPIAPSRPCTIGEAISNIGGQV